MRWLEVSELLSSRLRDWRLKALEVRRGGVRCGSRSMLSVGLLMMGLCVAIELGMDERAVDDMGADGLKEDQLPTG